MLKRTGTGSKRTWPGAWGGREGDATDSLQVEIAARIGGSREMVSRILSDLSAGGYIAVETKRVVLLRKLPASW